PQACNRQHRRIRALRNFDPDAQGREIARKGHNRRVNRKMALPIMSALGQERTCALQKGMSALPPIATAKANLSQTAMSALPLKVDCGACHTSMRSIKVGSSPAAFELFTLRDTGYICSDL